MYAFISFLLGLLIGSFLNVCICRLPGRKSIAWPGSACPACGAALKPRDLVPVASYVALRGRCRYCSARISPQYPLVELITGVFFALTMAAFGPTITGLCWSAFISLLIIACFADINTGLIPNSVTYPGIAAGLIFSLFVPQSSFAFSLIGCVVCGGVVWIVGTASRGGMGGGDVKLMAMVGAFLGWKLGLLVLFAGSLFGAIVGIARIASGKQKRRDPMPFGPFLAIAGALSVYFGHLALRLLGWE